MGMRKAVNLHKLMKFQFLNKHFEEKDQQLIDKRGKLFFLKTRLFQNKQ